ncbi:MAG: fused MFS/spermidine synthase [Rhizomicrobium sp.]
MAASDISLRSGATPGVGLAVLAFSCATFLSAALLFCVEPMFSKMVLPVLGGSAAVWSVAMVVFQGLLLAGYVYAHLLTRYLGLRHAALIHVCALALAALSLPIAISSGFAAPPLNGVSLWVMGLFLASIGLPCFVLSANAPLLQAWFARGDNAEAPNAYFLYRASNLGSFLVLLAYPFAIEPSFGLWLQSRLWSIGYIVLAFAIAACGMIAMRATAAVTTSERDAANTPFQSKFAWIALGFVPSGLLVAVTAHIATDVASGPFLWIMPLALYLLTFVFAFSDQPFLPPKLVLAVQPFTTAVLAILLLWTGKTSWSLSLLGHLLAFFVAAMVCQAELYRRRPEAAQLTQFYVWMSLGGVLGGAFAALIAPQIFPTVLEYPLLTLGALLVRPDMWTTPRATWLKDGAFVLFLAVALSVPFFLLQARIAYFAVSVMTLAALLAFQGKHPVRLIGLAAILLIATNLYDPSQSVAFRARSFYGVYKVVDIDGGKFRVLYHGTTAHGSERRLDYKGAPLTTVPEPLAYYYRGGPFSEAVYAMRAQHGGRIPRVALVGLGVGALTCYRQPGEDWTIYELDPLIAEIAHDTSLFRSVSACAPQTPTVIGDGRLTLRSAKSGIDLLMLDIFSSDAVPLHMLTREAFALYKARLSQHGAIAFNISNKNMELADAVAASAAANGMVTAVKLDTLQSPQTLRLRAEIAVVTKSLADMNALKLGAGWHIAQPAARVWTDDYSDMLSAIIAKIRA